jgi:hypothetical protein
MGVARLAVQAQRVGCRPPGCPPRRTACRTPRSSSPSVPVGRVSSSGIVRGGGGRAARSLVRRQSPPAGRGSGSSMVTWARQPPTVSPSDGLRAPRGINEYRQWPPARSPRRRAPPQSREGSDLHQSASLDPAVAQQTTHQHGVHVDLNSHPIAADGNGQRGQRERKPETTTATRDPPPNTPDGAAATAPPCTSSNAATTATSTRYTFRAGHTFMPRPSPCVPGRNHHP